MKLGTLKPGLAVLRPSLARAPTRSDLRMAGRALQERRLRLWTDSPCCTKCGRLTDIAKDAEVGFELDHRVRLADGGEDTDANCQVLCVEWVAGKKAGCHAEKTSVEGAGKAWTIV